MDDVTLTPREQQVLVLLAQDLSYQKIGRKLHVQYQTVTWHTNKIYAKLGVRGRQELTILMERAVVVGLEVLGECMLD